MKHTGYLMAKAYSKKYWIIYKDNKKVVKLLTWKEQANEKVVSSFYWDEEIPAKRYLHYLECKLNGTAYEMEE